MSKRKTLPTLALCAASSLICATAHAAPPEPPPVEVAAQARLRSTVDGSFERYLVSPHGDIDGLLLKDGTVVKVPPNSVPQSALGTGDPVHVEGEIIATPGGRMIERALLTRRGTTLVNSSEPRPPEPGRHARGRGPAADAELQPLTIHGTILMLLANRHGELDGLVLRDGTTARVPPRGQLAQVGLRASDTVTLTGRGGSYAAGRGLRVESIKTADGKTYAVDTPEAARTPMSRTGRVSRTLINPHGEVDTLLLADGTIVKLRHGLRDQAGTAIKEGMNITAEGRGGSYAQGVALDADRITLPDGKVLAEPVAPPPPPAL